MRISLLMLFISSLLFGTKILNTDLQKEQNHVALTLTFDTPYEGAISKGYQDNYLIVRMSDLTAESSFIKDNISPLVESLTVQSQNGETMIIAEAGKDVALSALKSKDGYTVRIRFDKQAAPAAITSSVRTETTHFKTLDYVLMVLLAIGGAALIFWLLRKKDQLFPSSSGTKKAPKRKISALSENPEPNHGKNLSDVKKGLSKEKKEVNIEIRFEEKIDENNRALLLVYNGREYPVVLGDENCFLNKHKPEDAPLGNELFLALVDDYIRTTKEKRETANDRQKSCDRQEAFESYKEKASRDTLF